MTGELRYKGILFGDDYWGTVYDEMPEYKNKKGVMMKQYLIVPSKDLVEAYPDKLKKKGALNIPTPIGSGLWVEYPCDWIVDKNPSRKNAIARIDCGFDSRDTPFTKRVVQLTNEIRHLQRENENLRIGKLADEEEKKNMMHSLKAWAEDVSEVYETIKGDKGGIIEDDINDIR